MWWVSCTCGTFVQMRTTNLAYGKQCSCGCAKLKNFAREELFETGSDLIAARAVYSGYAERAKSRHLTFELTFADFLSLTSKACGYCGIAPNSVRRHGAGSRWHYYTYNGIDRVDSSRGYAADNMVTCCARCNRAKLNSPVADFHAWLDQVAAFRAAPR